MAKLAHDNRSKYLKGIIEATCHLLVTACRGYAYDERVIRYNIHIPDQEGLFPLYFR